MAHPMLAPDRHPLCKEASLGRGARGLDMATSGVHQCWLGELAKGGVLKETRTPAAPVQKFFALMKCEAEHPIANLWGVCSQQLRALRECCREEKAIKRCGGCDSAVVWFASGPILLACSLLASAEPPKFV